MMEMALLHLKCLFASSVTVSINPNFIDYGALSAIQIHRVKLGDIVISPKLAPLGCFAKTSFRVGSRYLHESRFRLLCELSQHCMLQGDLGICEKFTRLLLSKD